eukprot:gene6016-7229_t
MSARVEMAEVGSWRTLPNESGELKHVSGSGKSTLGRLLFRFYDPKIGVVSIGGQDIKKVTQYSVRMCVGVVPQDTVMFNESILHNVRYGRMDATMDEVVEACKQAQILDFIESLGEKWDSKKGDVAARGELMQVGERGLKLSGGEKQRIAIASAAPRAVDGGAATSHLGMTLAVPLGQDALNFLGQNRTSMVIAHRLSTICNAGRIVVMDQGRVLEQGAHDELMAKGGVYAALWQAQLFENEIPGSMSASSSAANLQQEATAVLL